MKRVPLYSDLFIGPLTISQRKSANKYANPKYRANAVARTSRWKKANKEEVLASSARYRKNASVVRKASWAAYYASNSELILSKARARSKTDIWRKYYRERHHRNMLIPERKLRQNYRRRCNKAIRRNSVSLSTSQLLGCSYQELIVHMESLFKPGMSWGNYGKNGWHIDHIIPCSSFNLPSEAEAIKCFNFKNLQPLWWHENLSKGNKLTWQPAA
jgi:hypothetical protein